MSDNDEQAEFWASATGQKWVTHAARMDRVLAPVLQRVLDHARPAAGARVLDIGCGTGASCLALAELVGTGGRVTGVDIAPPLLEMARDRATGKPQIELHHADAAVADFRPAIHDLMVSRFGVMFFADTVAAFANIRRGLKPGARVVFATWGRIEANPWFTDPARAAKSVLGSPPKSDPDEPGPFALRDIDKTVDMLARAGLTDVTGSPVDLHLPGGSDLADAVDMVTNIGPAARTVTHFEAPPDQVADVRTTLAELWAGYDTLDGPMIPAEINIFTARAG